MSKTPNWLKGCKLVQFIEKNGLYVTYLKVGMRYIALSYSDKRNGWQSHTHQYNSLNDFLVWTTCSFSLREITHILEKKYLRTWIA